MRCAGCQSGFSRLFPFLPLNITVTSIPVLFLWLLLARTGAPAGHSTLLGSPWSECQPEFFLMFSRVVDLIDCRGNTYSASLRPVRVLQVAVRSTRTTGKGSSLPSSAPLCTTPWNVICGSQTHQLVLWVGVSFFGNPVGSYQPITVDQKRGGTSGTKSGCCVVLPLLPVVPAGEKAFLPKQTRQDLQPPIRSVTAYKTAFAIY